MKIKVWALCLILVVHSSWLASANMEGLLFIAAYLTIIPMFWLKLTFFFFN